MNYRRKCLGKKIPGISGVTGGAVLSVPLCLALADDPGAGNLWLALFVGVLMMVAGFAALRSTRRERGEEGGFGKGRSTS